MARAREGEKPPGLPCCISHEFSRSVSFNPNRVAVIHATGGIRVCKELRAILSRPGATEASGLIKGNRESSSPSVYRGDVCFTFGEVLHAVETLSVRIRRVLDGESDPDVVRPRGLMRGKKVKIVQKSGCRFPDIIGVCIGPSVEYIVCVLAILRCGEAFLPLDPLWPDDRIKHLVASSKTAMAIVCPPASFSIGKLGVTKFDWLLDEGGCSLLYLSMNKCLQDEIPFCASMWPCEDMNPRLFCYLMYTSGSTGKPKGVCGTEMGLLNRHVWMQGIYPLCNSDILVFKTSISFIDHIQEFLASVLTCTTLIIPPFYELRANPSYMMYILKVYHVSRMTAVPSLVKSIVPFLQSLSLVEMHFFSLKLLVLSGEALSMSLWRSIHELLPEITVLNLYGSTEISGDCLYFDCKNLSEILKVLTLTAVPIGVPLSNCDVFIMTEQPCSEEGELCVGGSCLFAGYLDDISLSLSEERCSSQLHFRTGDYVRRLPSGDYVFIGRKDRCLKINGQRVALEEIESTLREHPAVFNAAVTYQRTLKDTFCVNAFIVRKIEGGLYNNATFPIDASTTNEEFIFGLKKWLLRKLPLVMIPSNYMCIDKLPLTPTGKVDYANLETSLLMDPAKFQFDVSSYHCDHLEKIKQAFCDALLLEEVTEVDDFFVLGGNSLSAAQVAHTLGIDMQLIYLYPTPINLLIALNSKLSGASIFTADVKYRKRQKIQDVPLGDESQRRAIVLGNDQQSIGFRAPVVGLRILPDQTVSTSNSGMWNSNLPSNWIYLCSRGNHTAHGSSNMLHSCMVKMPCRDGYLQETWRVPLFSCVDASPLLLLKGGKFHLLIGSHSHVFLCIDALSGEVKWEAELDGRIECTASMTEDLLQVVIGCYMGKVYFIDFMTGIVTWVFQTDGEVKMQPVACNNLVWCGSHDHFLYALNYLEEVCVYKISCGGSIYGSPSIDIVKNQLYVASTSGRITSLCIQDPSFCILWSYEMGVPIFGSLCLNPSNGNVICCLVNGNVLAMDAKGSIVWKVTTGGPIFAGACISTLLPSQVIICSRNGIVYSFEQEKGQLLWEYNVRDPITAAAYVDEHVELKLESSLSSERLVCVCSSSGSIHVLRTSPVPHEDGSSKASLVQTFARIDLPGDIFSSPVMIGGRIFVGCRDDNVHCLQVGC